MSEMTSIAAALAALKTGTEIVKGLRGVEGKLREAELKVQIADLAQALADARVGVLEAREEIAALQARVKQMEAKPDFKAQLEQRDGVYYLKDPPLDRSQGPYCVTCVERDQVLIPLVHVPGMTLAKHRCPTCKSVY